MSGVQTEADKAMDKPADSIWDKQPQWPEGMEDNTWRDIKESPTLKNFVDENSNFKMPQLLKALVNMDKLRGGDNVLQIPTEDASVEERGEFMKKALGFNYQDIDTYVLKESKLNEETHNELRQHMFDSKLPPSIANPIVEKVEGMYQKFADDWTTETNNEIETGITELKDEWADGFDAKVALAKKALLQVAPRDVLDKIQSDPVISNHPILVKTMAAIGEMMFKETIFDKSVTSNFGMTKAQINEKIEEYRSMPEYHDSLSPKYRGLQEKVEDLYKKLY